MNRIDIIKTITSIILNIVKIVDVLISITKV